MSNEPAKEPVYLRAAEVFGLTQEEEVADRVSDERFRQLLDDQATTIHALREDENNFGEFVFVTLSRPAPQGRALMTFYGYGFHWLREQWFTEEWFFYEANALPEVVEQTASQAEAHERLKERVRRIQPYITPHEPSGHARFFAMLADLSDEDDAYAALADMGDLDEWWGVQDE